MRALETKDFAAFFRAVHGQEPFPWQTRLLERVTAEGRWPALLDLPTGSGKTAAIDVALFHLALDAGRPVEQRTAPRRIVMVVDRRTVVDQAFERAKRLANELASTSDDVVKRVASALRPPGGSGEPLAIAQLRGGMPRDDAWARRPDQPLVAVSTVDQVGSRLLFRGYGVSEAMRPIHAGLLGNDVLLLLDEVHLSEPFRQTLNAVARYRGWREAPLPDRWHLVEMSATPEPAARPAAPAKQRTPPPAGVERFALRSEDRADPRLARRLSAKKPFDLVEVKVAGGEAAKRATFAEACAARAAGFAKPGRVVGVVVNRVATAREVAARLGANGRLSPGKNLFLVTGRMRPLDRDDLDQEIAPLVRSGRERGANEEPVVIVSTQCIEAGADFDFDALVTECASLDALRQRFGRLNRLGDIDDAHAAVLARSDALAKDESDPIYGRALAKTWEWLGQGVSDFGVDAMEAALPSGETLEDMLAPRGRAPVMLPAHLDAWVQTKPAPVPDPEVALWLHGIQRRGAPEVQLVWRADLNERLLERAKADPAVREAVGKRMEACPPVALEALSVPLDAARAWLQGGDAPDLADVEGGPAREGDEDEPQARPSRGGRPALLWDGDDSHVIGGDAPGRGLSIPPGSTLVVPSAYGGLLQGNWDPTAKEPVVDQGDRARWVQTGRPTLRLHPDALSLDPEIGDARWARKPAASDAEEPDLEDRESIEGALAEMEAALPDGSWLRRALVGLSPKGHAGGRKPPAIVRNEPIQRREDGEDIEVEPGYLTVVGRFVVREGRTPGLPAGGTTTEGEDGSLLGVEVKLSEHLRGVASWAHRFAESCALPEVVAKSLVAAAEWHDAGKVDVRFQRMLRGGADSRVSTHEPIAKSKMLAADRTARQRAAERSGYPKGARHELASVALLADPAARLPDGVDRDLVLHLVASHHGWCRPFAPVAEDRQPVELELEIGGTIVRAVGPDEAAGGPKPRRTVRAWSDHGLERLDSGVADRFWRLVERYGWFGLAWLEAILRLADHRRSEEEQSGEPANEDAAAAKEVR
jgi:CRISPR-associated endonuclease/helicase Cas3